MDEGGLENGRQRIECYKGAHTQWNMMPQYQLKDQNAFLMHRKIMHIVAERDAAFAERERAISERKAAIDERDAIIQQRDAAMNERDNAVRERDNAIAALRFQESTMNSALNCGIQRTTKRMRPASKKQRSKPVQASQKTKMTDTFPVQAIPFQAVKVCKTRQTKQVESVQTEAVYSPRKIKKISEELNRPVSKYAFKSECDTQNLGLMNQINFDPSTMPTPVCSCTGVQRQCYKWGNGGWQSSCCTTNLSVHPLPRMDNKRHSRVGGRKMSGSVFLRSLSHAAEQGHDLRMPLDLREYWARHGTNRYVTIK